MPGILKKTSDNDLKKLYINLMQPYVSEGVILELYNSIFGRDDTDYVDTQFDEVKGKLEAEILNRIVKEGTIF